MSRLTVFFEDPFWVGVYERQCGSLLSACKVTFGAEPKDYEVLEFMEANWSRLVFSPPVRAQMAEDRPLNPKRAQREARKQTSASGVGTKAQQALQAARELAASESKARAKERREADEERKFELRQARKKEKHLGH